MDDLGKRGQGVGGIGGIVDNLEGIVNFSWFAHITTMGASAEGAEMMTLLNPPSLKLQYSPWWQRPQWTAQHS